MFAAWTGLALLITIFILIIPMACQYRAVAMDQLIDIRTPLAASKSTRVEIGEDGVLHVLAGPVTLHMDRAICEELTTTLAKAMVALARSEPRRQPPTLRVVTAGGVDGGAPSPASSHDIHRGHVQPSSPSRGNNSDQSR